MGDREQDPVNGRDKKGSAGEGEGVSCLARVDGPEVLVLVVGKLEGGANLALLREVLVVGFPGARVPGNFLACVGDLEGNGHGPENSGGDLKVSPFWWELIMQHSHRTRTFLKIRR